MSKIEQLFALQQLPWYSKAAEDHTAEDRLNHLRACIIENELIAGFVLIKVGAKVKFIDYTESHKVRTGVVVDIHKGGAVVRPGKFYTVCTLADSTELL